MIFRFRPQTLSGMTEEKTEVETKKAGIVSLVGRANVGKSTLVNALVGEKVAIVSPVAQTTRNRIRAVINEPVGQMVLLDTPGVHRAPSDLGRIMNRSARAAVEGVDAVVLVLDPTVRPREEDEGWMRRLARNEDIALTLFINKKDLHPRFEEALLALWEDVRREVGVPDDRADIRRGSAETGDGVQALKDRLFEQLPSGPPLFPDDVLSDFPRKLALADIIREKCFLRLYDELPHHLAVLVDEVDEADGAWTVHARIMVRKETQKPMVIGRKGRVLRAVKRAASREIEAQFGVSATLDLRVIVEKNWDRNHWQLKQLGYVE